MSYIHSFRPVAIFRASAAIVICCLLSSGALAAEIDFGTGDSIALDQTRVVVAVQDGNGTFLLDPSNLDTGLYSTFIADTGATGILLAKGAHFDLNEPSLYDSDRYETPYTYYEQGVGGVEPVALSTPHTVYMSGLGGALGGTPPGDIGTHQISNVHMLVAPDLDLGSFGGIIGMPGMVGRTMIFDLSNMSPLDLIATGYASNPSQVPAVAGTSHTFNFGKLTFDASTGQGNPSDPLPANESLPTLQVGTRFGTNNASGNYLFDTGAQLSMISSATATSLGLNIDPDDPNTDVLDFLTVGGVGGTADVPLVQVDQLRLDTNGGDTLVFNNILVGVIDIDGLPVDGILGYNIFTTGYLAPILASLGGDDELAQKDGAFLQMVLDFTQENWGMTLVTNDTYDPAQNEVGIIGDVDELSTVAQGLVFTPSSYALFGTPAPEPSSALLILIPTGLVMLKRRIS